MDFLFLTAANKTRFVRNDAEQAEWVQEEMSLNSTFPYRSAKVIETGQRILFQDPDTKNWQAFEIRNVKDTAFDGAQQITAEHIVISELTDEHIDDVELNNVTASAALAQALKGTQWSVGNVESGAGNASSGDLSRGSVWQAVNTIKENWNVYIEPRITVGDGGITGKYLDIRAAGGTWRGIRLSFDKNMYDPSVTFDDTDLKTALFGYGEYDSDSETDLTFKNTVWSKTADHPAKPKGQIYLEDPDATAAYGRNGRPRFGYYQNSAIDSASVLLQKTWEALKAAREPKISITGTVTDLYRFGYADQPLRLHDIALVEVLPFGLTYQKEIIQCRVDLLNSANTTPTIGDYIPNIVYINRATEESTTGSSGGSSGRCGGGTSGKETFWYKHIADKEKGLSSEIMMTASEIRTEVKNTTSGIYSRITQTASQIKSEVGNSLSTVYSSITQTASQIRSEVKNTASGLYSSITQTASQIRSEVKNTTSGIYSRITQTASQIRSEVGNSLSTVYSSITQTASQIRSEVNNSLSGVYSTITQTANSINATVTSKTSKASLILAINGSGGSTAKLSADVIDIDGLVTSLSALDITVQDLDAYNGRFSGDVDCDNYTGSSISVSGYVDCAGDIDAGGKVTAGSLKVGSYNASWKSATLRTITKLTSFRYFLYASSSGSTTPSSTQLGALVDETAQTTIYYLGR